MAVPFKGRGCPRLIVSVFFLFVCPSALPALGTIAVVTVEAVGEDNVPDIYVCFCPPLMFAAGIAAVEFPGEATLFAHVSLRFRGSPFNTSFEAGQFHIVPYRAIHKEKAARRANRYIESASWGTDASGRARKLRRLAREGSG